LESESQLPAQASPLLAIVTTAVLLEAKETGSVMAVFFAFCGVAVKL
jgi:hypothetical protein